jgi:hypothetical protein
MLWLRMEPSQPKHDPGMSGVWWLPAGLLIAAAAAIVLWWVLPPSAEVRGLAVSGPGAEPLADPLPTYVLETKGGLDEPRAATGGPEDGYHRYRRDTRFQWVLRPKVDSREPVGVRGFAFVDGGSAGLPLSLGELEQTAKPGTIEIAGTIEQLELEPGRYTIALAVGRPAALPTHAAELRRSSDSIGDEPWQVRRIEIEIED